MLTEDPHSWIYTSTLAYIVNSNPGHSSAAVATNSYVSSPQSTEKGLASPVRAQIISASLDGVPVKFETNTIQKANSPAGSALVFEQMSGKEWETWVRVHMGSSSGGPVEITYIVNEHNDYGKKGKGKERATIGSNLDVILPAFGLPIGQLQVDIENPSGKSWVDLVLGSRRKKNLPFLPLGFEMISVQSNLEHQQTRGDHRRLRQFGLQEFFYSHFRVHIAPLAHPRRPLASHLDEAPPPLPWPFFKSASLRATAHAAPAILALVLLVLLLRTYNDLGRLRTSLDRCGAPGSNWANAAAVPSVTVTATVVSQPRSTTTTGANDADAESEAEWGSDPDSASLAGADAAAGTPARSVPTFVTMIDITSPPLTERERAPRPPSGSDASAHGEYNALLPIERIPILWPIRLELPFTREQALEAVEHGLSVAWEILRRLYHFPLDPP